MSIIITDIKELPGTPLLASKPKKGTDKKVPKFRNMAERREYFRRKFTERALKQENKTV